MATIHEILSALQQQVTMVTAGLSVSTAVAIDYPAQTTLMAMVRNATAVVSVMDRKLSRNTTRWANTPIGGTVTTSDLISTVSNPMINAGGSVTITLSGAVTVGDAVSCVLTNNAVSGNPTAVLTPTWAVVVSAELGSTLDTMATALGAAINADSLLSTWVTAAVDGAVVTLTSILSAGVLGLQSLTGSGGTTITEIGRRNRQVAIMIWASTIENRDTVGDAISNMAQQMEVYYGAYPSGLAFADGTGGNVTVMNDFEMDEATMSDTYRRDIILTIDYPITTTDILYSVLMPPLIQVQAGFFTPAPISP